MRPMLRSALLLLAFTLCALGGDARASEAPPEFKARLERMRTATASLQQYTCTFRREEWQGGKPLGAQLMAIKFRKPMDIYMRWEGETYKGRELIFRRGWNDDKLHVKPTPGALVPTLNLDPEGGLAMRGSRHSIDMVDMGNIVSLILRQTDKLEKSTSLSASFTDQGPQVVNGEASRCMQVDLPKQQDPALYARRVDMCMSDRTGLLTRLRTWDEDAGEVRKVEDYEFRSMNLSPGLTDADFDPENEAYGF